MASPRVEMIEHNISENEFFAKQRDELLPLLMNGQASVNYHLLSRTMLDKRVANSLKIVEA